MKRLLPVLWAALLLFASYGFIWRPVLAQAPAPTKTDKTGEVQPLQPEQPEVGLKDLEPLLEVLKKIRAKYPETIDKNKLIEGAMGGMIRATDPYGNYWAPEQAAKLMERLNGSFGGIGIQFSYFEGLYYVMSVFSGGPAARAGMLPGDILAEVDGKSLQDPSIVGTIRGLIGKPVTVKVLRKPYGPGKPYREETFTLEREAIISHSVALYQMLDSRIGYVRLSDFEGERTSWELFSVIEELRKSRGMQGLILDLRFNPGGLTQNAITIARFFLRKDQTVVSLRGPDVAVRHKAFQDGSYMDIPLAVLVNEKSASASELMAGSLQDNGRAVVIGTSRTFGKGIEQSIEMLPNGAFLSITHARYFLPSGRCVQNDPKTQDGGVHPDILVPSAKEFEKQLPEIWLRRSQEEHRRILSQDPVVQKALDVVNQRLSAVSLRPEETR